MLRDFPILELQADELFAFVGSKRRTIRLRPTAFDAAVLPRIFWPPEHGRAARSTANGAGTFVNVARQ